MALKYQRGTIIIASQVPDQNGVNPKDRRVVLVRDFHDTDATAYGVAVTGTFDYPIPPTSISLPFHRQGRCNTGLRKESVAVCNWFVVVAAQDILNRSGFTPTPQLVAILGLVQAVMVSPLAPPPGGGTTGSVK
jgi:hypothetical protein